MVTPPDIGERVARVESQVDALAARVAVTESTAKEIDDKIDDIRELLSSRPTWLISGAFITLAGVCSSLVTALLVGG